MLDTASCGVEVTTAGVAIKIFVTTRSSSNKIVGVHNGAIKVSVTAPPVGGAANKALVEFLAKVLGVPKGAVRIASGETSRHKSIAVTGVDAQNVLKKLVASDQGFAPAEQNT